MAIFKCKMCGGTIEFEQGATVGVCDSCGTKQTLPRLDDDKKTNLYDRANHFRRNNDFDKAMGIYENILNEDNTDAEAYWSIVLCRYGIEYVEDPQSHKRIPTVNRAQFTSVLADEDYKSAIKYADISQKSIYEEEAKTIDNIQKGILDISSKEEPFDVFICYKETDANGRRTQDSVLATELYNELTRENYKVFFSRITLEDKLGTAYEPYIFAALNSAKVMVVLGTRAEYFNAVWVKNEWSRYLALIKSGARKMLIPAYRDMDPYDLPEEFSHLQAQDMSKLGFMQDLIRGIKKIVSVDAPNETVKETVVVNNAVTSSANTAPLLERVFIFLEDGKWQDADIYCEKVLDIDPKNAEAYLGKLMAELKVKNRKQLADCAEPFDDSDNFAKVIRFGDEKLEDEIRGYIKHINERNELARLNGIYNNAQRIMQNAQSEENFKKAAFEFDSIPQYKDAKELAEKCREQAEVCRKDAVYDSAKSKMDEIKSSSYEETVKIFKTIPGFKDADSLNEKCSDEVKTIADKCDTYKAAIKIFQTIPGWKDADEQVVECRKKLEEIEAKEEADRLAAERKAEEERIAAEKAAKKRKKIIAIATPVVCACIAFIIVLNAVIIPSNNRKKAYKLYGEIIKNANVGDIIKYGKYEQDNNTSNGKEDIEWLVLAKEDNKILVISDKALDCQQYNTYYTNVTWENCSLRKWLNGQFLNVAFSTEEKAIIQSTAVSSDNNSNYSTNPGNATTDKVFLLSITEANKYFSSDEDRKCVPTAYAIAQGAYTSSNYTKGGAATCWWWLRSPGFSQIYAASVSDNGSVYYLGYYVYRGSGCIRPAMWINLDS